MCARAWESIGKWESIGNVVLLCGESVKTCMFGKERQCVRGKFVAGQV